MWRKGTVKNVSDSVWYKNAVFYGLDIRRFKDSNGDGIGDIQGVIDSLDYLAYLGVDALWLLPFFQTPFLDNGYDVSDYYEIDPNVGTLEDFSRLIEAAKQRHIHLVIDLVMNHTSNQHPWFQAARRDPRSSFRNYYVWSDSPPLVPRNNGQVFPGEESNVWTYDPLARSYYFHRFYSFQPDLRIANPNVRDEIRRVMDFWLSFGVAGFRMDAAALMINMKGLASTKLDDPHSFFREISLSARKRLPDAVLLAEANVPLDHLNHYFGKGDQMTMLMNFMVNMHVFLAFARQSAEPIRDLLKGALDTPPNGQWLNFLRNLDELTLDQLPPEQRNVVLDRFAPETEKRIYERGIRSRLAPLLDGDRRCLEMAFSLLFSLPGSPMFMYGDEIGMGDNLALPGRNAVRTPMQWSAAANAGFSTADSLIAPVIQTGPFSYEQVNVEKAMKDKDSFLHWMRKLITVRKQSLELGKEPARLLETIDDHDCLLAHIYGLDSKDPEVQPICFFHNLSDQPLKCALDLPSQFLEERTVLFGNGTITHQSNLRFVVDLPPYGYLWTR